MKYYRIVLVLIEFWAEILAIIPMLVVGVWFAFRKYLVVQNDFLNEYKATIDVALAILGILVALGWLDAYKNTNIKDRYESTKPIKKENKKEKKKNVCLSIYRLKY